MDYETSTTEGKPRSKRIIVNDSTDPAELSSYLHNPDVIVDITQLSRKLPAHTRAKIYSAKTVFYEPGLETSSDIDARAAKIFLAPKLRKAGNIYAPNAEMFHAHRLKDSGFIMAPNVRCFVAWPKLHEHIDLPPPVRRKRASGRSAQEHAIPKHLTALTL